MRIRSAAFLLIVPAALAAQQPPLSTAGGPLTTTFRGTYARLHRLLPQAFDSIPGDKFGYKPTPAQQSIGYIAQHLANDNYFFCNDFGEKKATRPADETSTPDSVKATWPKDKLVASLKASIAFCQEAYEQIDDAKLSEMLTVPGPGGTSRQIPRLSRVLGHALDMTDHYSQLANYMRLNGMLPPSALPRPRPAGN
jgi:uncharacterized damage-inducible protein DinB